ncbi:MAG: hypothetical protein RSG50_11440 [Clostridia bacterium]
MSVPKWKRKEGDMAVIMAVRSLCKYTLTICKNEKRFPKRNRWVITDKIVREAIRAALEADKANDVRVECWADYKRRRKHQKRALEAIRGIITLKQIAYETLPSARGEFPVASDQDRADQMEQTRVIAEIDQAYATCGEAPPVMAEQKRDPMEYWTGLCIDARNRLRKWRDSEKRDRCEF